jgi:nicotinamide-nucleotide adenylyltransferase
MTEEIAHVHGRFQPFHDEHLEYVRWAASDHPGDRLVIGITNADAAHTARTEADPERHRPRNNPFTYYERQRMIDAALGGTEADLGCAVSIVPFPINRPELWDAYAPADAVHYVNVLEEWHEHKLERLREHGRAVESKRGTRTISGTEIRTAMADGDPWADRVPDPVAADIREHGLVDRVRARYSENE